MRLIDRYIRNAVIGATGLVVLVLLGVESFMEFITQLSDIGVSHYGMGEAFIYVLTQIPVDLYQLFPMAGFLGCLIGLGRLASSSQLIVMRAAGVSIGGITWSVIKAALIMMVVVTFVGEFIAPKLESQGDFIKATAMSRAVGYKAVGGVWLRDGSSFIHIGKIDSPHEISDVSRFVIDQKHHLLLANYANKGVYADKHWTLFNVTSSAFGANRISKGSATTLPLKVVFDPTELQEGKKSIDQQSISALYRAIRYRNKAGLETSQYNFNFWERVIQPFTTVMMICLGVPFIFGSLRSASMGLRVLTGVIIGFTFYMLNQFFGPFAMVYQIPAVFAALTPTVLFVVACGILLRRLGSVS